MDKANKVVEFLRSFPNGTRAEWARKHDLDPTRLSQIANGHKGIGLDYAIKIIKGSDGQLCIDDFEGLSDKAAA